MTENTQQEQNSDGTADACATVAIISIVVAATVFWLSGLPS